MFEKTLNHLYRSESGKMVSVLTRIFGSHHLSMAEDVVQDSFQQAIQSWSAGRIPDNPAGWLMLTAKRKAINVIRKERHLLAFAQDMDPMLKSEWSLATTVEQVFLEDEIQDSQLRMMFTCCHPAFPSKTQLAFTLKSLCGFKTIEIAKALLSNEDAIQKSIYRAKQKIKKDGIQFSVPTGGHLSDRLHGVLLTIYLLFNEGYNASSHEDVIRKDLCYEAMRLAGLLVEQFPNETHPIALLALLCFHTARFDARIDDHGCIVILQDQDRSKWNQELIDRGLHLLNQASRGESISAYHIEASIAALHCTTAKFEETNWDQIHDWYGHLYKIKPSPIIKLNRAIISGKIHGPAYAIAELHKLEQNFKLKSYYLLYASLGQFYAESKRKEAATKYFEMAKNMTASQKEKNFLEGRMAEL